MKYETSMRAGTRYQITISSDAPIAVLSQDTIVPETPDGD